MELTRADLVRDFRALGLRPGLGVMVHSSLKSLGRVAGGPATVIEALQESLTDAGTLLLPSFNHGRPFRPGGAGCYSPIETPTINGAIPDHFWRRPEVRRTLDPTHPIAAWGRQARVYLKDHHRTWTMGPDSPLGRLGRDGGYGLLIGVGYGTSTFMHVVEMTLRVPCLGVRTEACPVRLPDGRIVRGRTWGWRERSCPTFKPAQYTEAELERLGLHLRGRVGAADCCLFRLEDCFRILSGIFTGAAGGPACRACPVRPRRDPATVPSDWDFENQCLAADSAAWGYEDGL